MAKTDEQPSTEKKDSYKAFNETLKAFEALKKIESELLQKLSQANDDIDLSSKKGWAKELTEVVEALERMNKSRVELIKQLK